MIDEMKFIPLASPDIQDLDIQNVVKVLKSGNLIQGEQVLELENIVSTYLGVKHCIAVSNGTATMHLTLKSLGIGIGDEVIVPAFSYVATANVVELVGAKPVFVDIDIDTFNIQKSRIESAITEKTKAIIPVHEFGLACDIKEIYAIAKRNNIYVIEDAACALGAKDSNQFAGTFGDVGSFSLHPRKAITSGEGGLIVTNDSELDRRLRILRNHGIEYVDGKMNFVEAGFNYRLTDIQAALVKSQFRRLDSILATRNELAQVYFEEIRNPLVKLPAFVDGKVHTWQTFHVLLDSELSQDNILKYLKTEGIGSNYGAQCIPFQHYYASKYHHNCSLKFPNALLAFKQGLALPLYEKLSKEQVSYISRIVNKITK
jgi:dTDP-4-amino-4,6-dideoxygalactose transaminase